LAFAAQPLLGPNPEVKIFWEETFGVAPQEFWSIKILGGSGKTLLGGKKKTKTRKGPESLKG